MILCQKFVRKGALVLVSVAGLVSVCACDDTYDLSNVSTDITIGGNISLPVGSTDTLRLERAIELSGNLKVDENSVYALQSNGSMNMNIAKVSRIHIVGLNPDPVVTDLSVGGIGSEPIEFLPISLPFSEVMTIDQYEEVPNEVESLSAIEIEPIRTELVLDLSLANPAAFAKLRDLRVENFTIHLPKALVFSPGIEGLDYATNVLSFTKQFDALGDMRIPLEITGLKRIPKVVDGKLHFVSKMSFDGELAAVGEGVASNDFSDFKLTVSFEIPDFYVSRIKGTINTNIAISDSEILLRNLPEALMDGKTDVNANIVGFAVEVTNPVGVPFDAQLLLTAQDKAGNPINQQVAVPIKVAKAIDYGIPSISRLYVTNSQTLAIPQGYDRVIVDNLNKIVGKIPLTVSIRTSVDVDKTQEHFLELGRPYNSQANYIVDVPFDLGAGSHIIYREEIDNLNSDLSDISDKVPTMEVYADIFSTIPLALDVDIYPLDIYGNDMSAVLQYTKKISLDPGYENAPSQAKQISIKELEPGALENLDKIELVVDGNSSVESVLLKPSQYLYLKMKAKLPNGVNIREDK